MRRAQFVMSALVILGMLLSWPHDSATSQQLALSERRPRFLYAPSRTATPVEMDATRSAVFRRVVSLEVERPTIGRLLAAIERQAKLTFAYGGDLPADQPIEFRAASITIAAALSAILLDTGMDVLLLPGGNVSLVKTRSGAIRVQGGSVGGRVTDVKSGQAVSGADVSLDGTRWRTTTDADGHYRLIDVALGSYTVLTRRIGYAPERRPVTVTAGQDATVDVALQPAATRLGEVVVTAQKREERLQDVPLSIAVVTPEEIDRRGLVSAEDYLRGIPGVNQVTQGPNDQTIVVRGLETQPGYQNGYGTDPTTATYFGETATSSSVGGGGSTAIDLKLVDIERVEVLRGPQGTAFGSSSMGGAVRTIPVAPKLDRIEGRVGSSYSVTSGTGGDNYHVQGAANVPVVKDKLALRAVGYRYEDSGFYRSAAGSDPTFQSTVVSPYGAQTFAADGREVGASRFTGGRMTALFQAGDRLHFTLMYLKQKSESDGFAGASSGPYEQAFLEVAPEHVLRGQTRGVFDTDIDLANAKVEYDLGWANLLATYSYTNSAGVTTFPFNAIGLPWAMSQIASGHQRMHSGEIRLTTRLNGAWNFLGGLYADDIEDDYLYSIIWTGNPETNFLAPGQLSLGSAGYGRNVKQKAAFAEASWEFLPDFTLTGGVRAYDYNRTSHGFTIATGAFAPSAVGRGPTSGGGAPLGTSFRANLSHKLTENALVYAGWAQGFRLGRPGGAGLPASLCDLDSDGIVDGTLGVTIESTKSVDADDVDNYELGGKFTLLDRRLLIAADVYRADWTGLPVLSVAQSCQLAFITNAGVARSEGIEFQANFYASEAFRIDVGGSWTRARITADAPAQGWVAGDRLPGSPEFNANLGLQYEFKIGGSAAFVRADPIYVGPFYGNVQQSASTRSGDYVKVDASARVALRHLDIDLFARNLTNRDAFTFRGLGLRDQGPFFGYRLRPRTIGLQLSRNF